MPKPNLSPVVDFPVVRIPTAPREDTPAVKEARRKFGKPFAGERGFRGGWQSGPTVLTAERILAISEENEKRRNRK